MKDKMKQGRRKSNSDGKNVSSRDQVGWPSGQYFGDCNGVGTLWCCILNLQMGVMLDFKRFMVANRWKSILLFTIEIDTVLLKATRRNCGYSVREYRHNGKQGVKDERACRISGQGEVNPAEVGERKADITSRVMWVETSRSGSTSAEGGESTANKTTQDLVLKLIRGLVSSLRTISKVLDKRATVLELSDQTYSWDH